MTLLEIKLRLGLLTLLFVACAAYTMEALTFSELAQWAPLFAGAVATLLTAVGAMRETHRLWTRLRFDSDRTYRRTIEHVEDDGGVTQQRLRSASIQIGWLVGMLLLTWLFGLAVVGPLFVAIFLRLDSHKSWRFVLLSAFSVAIIMWFFGSVVGLLWPEGVLTS